MQPAGFRCPIRVLRSFTSPVRDRNDGSAPRALRLNRERKVENAPVRRSVFCQERIRPGRRPLPGAGAWTRMEGRSARLMRRRGCGPHRGPERGRVPPGAASTPLESYPFWSPTASAFCRRRDASTRAAHQLPPGDGSRFREHTLAMNCADMVGSKVVWAWDTEAADNLELIR